MIGCAPGITSNPLLFKFSRQRAVFVSSRSRSDVSASSMSNTFSEAATIGGATALLNRYGRLRCRNRSTIGLRAAV